MFPVLSLYVVLCIFSIIQNTSLMFPAEKRINQTKKVGGAGEGVERTRGRHWQYCVCVPRKWLQTWNYSASKHWGRKIIYGNSHGSFPTRNFSTKENERHSPRPWSMHDAAPVWSDKGLISYDRLLQLRQYKTPINSPAINSLHWTLFLSICSCLTSIRAPFSCLQVVVSIWR